MFKTTIEAVNAVLKADPGITPADRARLLALLRNHGKDAAPPRVPTVTENCILPRAAVAMRFGRSKRFIDKLASAGILRRVKMPGRQRACGFLAIEVERLMTGEGVTK